MMLGSHKNNSSTYLIATGGQDGSSALSENTKRSALGTAPEDCHVNTAFTLKQTMNSPVK